MSFRYLKFESRRLSFEPIPSFFGFCCVCLVSICCSGIMSLVLKICGALGQGHSVKLDFENKSILQIQSSVTFNETLLFLQGKEILCADVLFVSSYFGGSLPD